MSALTCMTEKSIIGRYKANTIEKTTKNQKKS